MEENRDSAARLHPRPWSPRRAVGSDTHKLIIKAMRTVLDRHNPLEEGPDGERRIVRTGRCATDYLARWHSLIILRPWNLLATTAPRAGCSIVDVSSL